MTALTTSTAISDIPGWGMDADPQNDPAYPMRHLPHDADRRLGMDWHRPAQQPKDVEILCSIEHQRMPAVFGTSTPPKGLSGIIRRVAFRRSESDWWHWLMLMGADRINVAEGVADDLAGLRVPNIPAEMGIKSELKYNKRGLAKKLGTVALLGGGLLLLRRLRRTPEPIDGGLTPSNPDPMLEEAHVRAE